LETLLMLFDPDANSVSEPIMQLERVQCRNTDNLL